MSGYMGVVDGVENGCLPLDDRGLAYGHGVFETMEIASGRVPHWARHWRRLTRGCARLGIRQPDEARVRATVERQVAGHPRAVLKLLVTAGSGGAGYRVPAHHSPRCIVAIRPWPQRQIPDAGVAVRLCATRLPFDARLAGIKHLNRLHSVLARAEWGDTPEEGLLSDPDGNIVEGTMSNVFWVEGDTLLSPDLSRCGVAGIMRERILEWAERAGIATSIARCPPARLLAADGVFVCNSLIGVWPVARVDHQGLPDAALIRRVQSAVSRGAC
ncbi:aminodeoxychorismate lyase [Acidihalobacter ferrooxydans]|nr:aminodeoxychorismate lyase [Acidihalobacter ferrooxydans]